MPFDPNLPQAGTEIDADQMRSQLNGLKDLIDAVPAGPPGPEGPAGPEGPVGPEGPAGPQGEVSQQDLADAINGTANNCDIVELLSTIISDPPTQYEVEEILNKVNELIQALYRNG